MLFRAVIGFPAGAGAAVAEADVSGWDAWANDEAPKAAKETTLKAVPPKIRAKPPICIVTVLSFLRAAVGRADTFDWVY
jgi:hypothetical protein